MSKDKIVAAASDKYAECKTCGGRGEYLYSDSGMGMGPGGQMMTWGPCPGTRRRPDFTDCPVVLRNKE